MPPDPPSRCVLCTHILYIYFHIRYQWPLHFLFAPYTTDLPHFEIPYLFPLNPRESRPSKGNDQAIKDSFAD